MTDQNPIVFLNRSYWPDVEATGQLLTELCESLQLSYDIHVVAGKPNQVRDQKTDLTWPTTPSRNGVTIHRVEHLQLPKRSMLLKAANYLSFVRGCRKVLKKIQPPGIVVFETDPFLLPFEALRLQKRTGCRMIGYLQDIYPDVAVALGKVPNNWAIKRLRESLFSVYRRCDRMIVLSEDMKELLVDAGIDQHRIDLVPNWADSETIFPIETENAFRQRYQLGDHFVVMYSGNLGLTQRLEQFLDAAEFVSDDQQILFAFVGQGSQKATLEKTVQQRKLTNVRFFDYQPKSELAHSLSAGDLHLVPLTRELSQCLMPSKLYGIMAAGRPYLTNAVPESELHRMTVQHNIGMTVPPDSVSAIAEAIRNAKANPDLLKQMSGNARRLAQSEYSLEKSVAKFKAVLDSVAAGDSLVDRQS